MSAVVLKVSGMGPVPSFKNKKRIGKHGLFTDLKTKRWMDQCIQSFAFQLRSECQIREGGTSTECLARFWTRLLPADDCWTELEIGFATCELVEKGQEGAEIIIKRLE